MSFHVPVPTYRFPGVTPIEWREDRNGGLSPFLGNLKTSWAPLPGSQIAFLSCPLFEVLYEGTRGPGKTDCLLMDFLQHVGKDTRTSLQKENGVPQMTGWGQEWRGVLFRQSFPQLTDVIHKSMKLIRTIWPEAKYNKATSTWRWETGEMLKFSWMERPEDYWNFHGHSYTWVAFEELTTWAEPSCYTMMMSCCRSTRQGIPIKYRGTTNPYGPGHNWVKARFHLPNHNGMVTDVIEGNRIAIHGSLDENFILMHADPQYKERLRQGARNEAELRAWLFGDWEIVAGGMLDDLWDAKVHVVPTFKVPSSWKIDRSFDWGSSRPFSVGWWAQSDGTNLEFPDGSSMSTLPGDLFRIGEWYGWSGQPNEGLRMTAREIAQGIVERELEMGIRNRVKPGPADSAIFTEEDGKSIAGEMLVDVKLNGETHQGIQWLYANKRPGSRKQGWEVLRERLRCASMPNREGPGIYFCRNCSQALRTLPVLPRNERDLDDVNTQAEDHVADEVRYRVLHAKAVSLPGKAHGMA